MNDRQRMIGYNRTVKLRWLDETVDLYLAGMSDSDIYQTLSERLKDELSIGSTAIRGSREKTITLLLKTWVRVPKQLEPLRDEATKLLQGVRRSERLPFHWGMTMAAYPFWRLVAEVTGRLFRLQGTVTPLQVQRRVKEIFGEREAVARSARYVLRAFADWNVINDLTTKGEYSPVQAIPIADLDVAAWLFETAVVSRGLDASDFQTLVNGTCFFPSISGRLPQSKLQDQAEWKSCGTVWRKPSFSYERLRNQLNYMCCQRANVVRLCGSCWTLITDANHN